MLRHRFVGWITNFIHNRKDPDINMIRGYLTSTVGRSVDPARMATIRRRPGAHIGADPTTGFLSRSSDVLHSRAKASRGVGRSSSSFIHETTAGQNIRTRNCAAYGGRSTNS